MARESLVDSRDSLSKSLKGLSHCAGHLVHHSLDAFLVARFCQQGGNPAAADNVDILRQFTPFKISSNSSNSAVQSYYDQNAILNPAFHTLSVVITALSGKNATIDPNVLRIYGTLYRGQRALDAKYLHLIAWEMKRERDSGPAPLYVCRRWTEFRRQNGMCA